MSSIWVDKYKPQTSNELAGQSRNIARIKSWLKTYDPSKSRPLFIYGPPGIGKTTAAHLCCKETGYQTVEFNASDQRNKNIMKDVISTISSNSRLNLFGRASETKDAIILDEIDGMAGNEDRGGIGQLLIEIRKTKKPMIFICNDGQHQKLRSLKDKCETVEFRRPEFNDIRQVISRIARKEGLDVDKINVKQLAESSDYDIRQIVNSLSLFRDGSVEKLVKTTRMNAFEATKKVLTASRQTIDDRFECFFADYNIMPLFIFENYSKNRPVKGDHLKSVARAAQALSLSDLVEKEIRSNQNWSLLNCQALLSTVIPSSLVATNAMGRVDFPQFLGKLSNANKRLNLTQELNAHMCLKLRGGLDPDSLDVMRERLSTPLIKKGTAGVDEVLDFMQEYSLTRDDLNSLFELATWSFKPEAKIDSKVKLSLTTAYKKRSYSLPYYEDGKVTKVRKTAMHDMDDDAPEEEDEEEEEVIKPKKVVKKETKKETKKEDKKEDKKESKREAKKPVADKRPPPPVNGNIGRFFMPKKQKSS